MNDRVFEYVYFFKILVDQSFIDVVSGPFYMFDFDFFKELFEKGVLNREKSCNFSVYFCIM